MIYRGFLLLVVALAGIPALANGPYTDGDINVIAVERPLAANLAHESRDAGDWRSEVTYGALVLLFGESVLLLTRLQRCARDETVRTVVCTPQASGEGYGCVSTSYAIDADSRLTPCEL